MPRKAAKPKPVDTSVRGTHCPNCDQETRYPEPSWAGTDEKPHENPFDCIRYLAARLRNAEDNIRSVERDVRDIDTSGSRC